jgi:hypothetical protein
MDFCSDFRLLFGCDDGCGEQLAGFERLDAGGAKGIAGVAATV